MSRLEVGANRDGRPEARRVRIGDLNRVNGPSTGKLVVDTGEHRESDKGVGRRNAPALLYPFLHRFLTKVLSAVSHPSQGCKQQFGIPQKSARS